MSFCGAEILLWIGRWRDQGAPTGIGAHWVLGPEVDPCQGRMTWASGFSGGHTGPPSSLQKSPENSFQNFPRGAVMSEHGLSSQLTAVPAAKVPKPTLDEEKAKATFNNT